MDDYMRFRNGPDLGGPAQIAWRGVVSSDRTVLGSRQKMIREREVQR